MAKAPKQKQKKRRLGGRSARVHEAVLTAAFELLSANGVDNITVAAVAARAGVHETSIYRRWGSLKSVVSEACLHYIEDTIPIPDTGSLRSDLVALTRRAVTMLGSPQGQVILALTQLRNKASLRARHEYWQARFERMRPIFDRAISRGEFPGDAEPVVVLQTLIAPLYFRLLVSVDKLDDWPVDELVDRLLRGYKSSPSKTRGR